MDLAARFSGCLTKKKRFALKSNVHSFIYTYCIHNSNKYNEWKCLKHKQSRCRGRFCGSLDNQWYWKHNPHHTCVDPPQDDLTPEEEEQKRQKDAETLLDEVLPRRSQSQVAHPKTKAISKPTTKINQKQIKNGDTKQPTALFKVEKTGKKATEVGISNQVINQVPSMGFGDHDQNNEVVGIEEATSVLEDLERSTNQPNTPNDSGAFFQFLKTLGLKKDESNQVLANWRGLYPFACLSLDRTIPSNVVKNSKMLFAWNTKTEKGGRNWVEMAWLLLKSSKIKDKAIQLVVEVTKWLSKEGIYIYSQRSLTEEVAVDKESYHKIRNLLDQCQQSTQSPTIIGGIGEKFESFLQNEGLELAKEPFSKIEECLIQDLRKQLDAYKKKIEELERIQQDKITKRWNMDNESSQSSTLTVKTKEINVIFNLDFAAGFLKDNRVLKEFLKRNGHRLAQIFYPKGLENPNATTCYLNVILQLIFHVNQFFTHTRLFNHNDHCRLYYKFFEVSQDMLTQQQDVVEYLEQLFGTNKCEHLIPFVQFQTIQQIICRECQEVKYLEQPKECIIQVSPSKFLQDAINQHFNEDDLPDYICTNCSKQKCKHKFILDQSSQGLIIQIKRFDNSLLKDETLIDVPEILDVQKQQYHLQGFIVHIGETIQQGHYIYCYRSYTENWVVLDDNKDQYVAKEGLNQQGYVFFYTINKNDGTKTPVIDVYMKDAIDTITAYDNYIKQTKHDPKLVLTKEQQKTFKIIKQRYHHLVDGPSVTQGLVNDSEIDTVFESLISSKKGRNKSKQHTTTPTQLQHKQIMKFLKYKFIGSEDCITDFNAVFDDNFWYNTLPKLFQLVGDSFVDGMIIYFCKSLFKTQEEFRLFANGYISIKSVKRSQLGENYLFVRLNDDHAKITKQLYCQILDMMTEYRSRVSNLCQKQGISHDQALQEWQYVHIKQLDSTHEIAGCIYSNDLDGHLDKIAQAIGMRPAWKYNSFKSCLQFEEYHKNNHTLMTGRQKLYCKVPLHLLQTESLTQNVSMGLKPLMMPSTTFYRNLQQTQQDSLSRSERSYFFNSIQSEVEYLLQDDPQNNAKEYHTGIIDFINKDRLLLAGLNSDTSIAEGWKIFWENVTATIILYTESLVYIIYGYNSDTGRYYGVSGTYPYGKNIVELVKRYAVPLKYCYTYRIYEKGRYDHAKFKKKSMIMQIPFLELCKNHNLNFQYDFLDVLPFQMVASLKPSNIEIEDLCKMTTLSANQQKLRDQKILAKFAQRYTKRSNFTKVYESLKEGNIIFVVSYHQGNLYLYDDTRREKFKLKMLGTQWSFFIQGLLDVGFRKYGQKYIHFDGFDSSSLRTLISTCLKFDDNLPKATNNQLKMKQRKLAMQMRQTHRNDRLPEDHSEQMMVIQNVIKPILCSQVLEQDVGELVAGTNKQQPSVKINKNFKHPRVQFQGHTFRFKGALKDGFSYECIHQKKKRGCVAQLRVNSTYIPQELIRKHNQHCVVPPTE